MKWLGVHIVDSPVRFKGDMYLEDNVRLYGSREGIDLNIFTQNLASFYPVNDGNPTFSLGSAATDSLKITSTYNSGAQTLDSITFNTLTSSSTAHDGKFIFKVDDTQIFNIYDDGLYLNESMNLYIGSVVNPILTDSSGTTTLNNIDALDATTTATFEAAMEANIDTLTNLSKIAILNASSGNPGSNRGSKIDIAAYTFTDTGTGEGATSAAFANVAIGQATVACGHTATITNAASLYIANAPVAGSNMTLSNRYALWIEEGNAKFDGNIDLEGDMDVDGTLETDALTIGGTALTSVCSPVAGHSSIATVGTISSGTWQGGVIASAYLDADTVHYSAQRQMTYHMFQDDINTDKIYVGLQEADAESGTSSNKNLPFLAPVAGKLLKIFLRANHDLSTETLTWRLETRASSASTSGSPSVVGTQSGTGCTASSMTTYDFTSSLDSGDNIIDAGDTVQLSIQADSDPGGNIKYYVTCLWEWDLS
jgi:hypothetical protein